LEALVAVEQDRWAELDPDLIAPLAALGHLLLSGGKRLRPAFCHWAFVAAGGDVDTGASVEAGAAFELLHAFALMHDDVMDGSPTRRGTPTIHVEFGHRHLPIDFSLDDKSRYINLGDWIRYFSYAVFDGQQLELKYYTEEQS